MKHGTNRRQKQTVCPSTPYENALIWWSWRETEPNTENEFPLGRTAVTVFPSGWEEENTSLTRKLWVSIRAGKHTHYIMHGGVLILLLDWCRRPSCSSQSALYRLDLQKHLSSRWVCVASSWWPSRCFSITFPIRFRKKLSHLCSTSCGERHAASVIDDSRSDRLRPLGPPTRENFITGRLRMIEGYSLIATGKILI